MMTQLLKMLKQRKLRAFNTMSSFYLQESRGSRKKMKAQVKDLATDQLGIKIKSIYFHFDVSDLILPSFKRNKHIT